MENIYTYHKLTNAIGRHKIIRQDKSGKKYFNFMLNGVKVTAVYNPSKSFIQIIETIEKNINPMVLVCPDRKSLTNIQTADYWAFFIKR